MQVQCRGCLMSSQSTHVWRYLYSTACGGMMMSLSAVLQQNLEIEYSNTSWLTIGPRSVKIFTVRTVRQSHEQNTLQSPVAQIGHCHSEVLTPSWQKL